MEREILFSGIGGQGIQLAARSLAVAAMRERRRVLMFGTYGGAMRGGDTDATIVIGVDSLVTPPVIDHAWAGLAMHPKGWPAMAAKLRPGGLVIVNTSVFEETVTYDGIVLPLAATAIAAGADMPQAGAMIALGAFAAATGIVALATLLEIAEEVLPPYRQQFAEPNRLALALGHQAVTDLRCAAWSRLEMAA
ncbi:2-oxoacid:acceptor oxidoreductase family protein [uncultured Sphingomonas sp.]|uniref:2-oxoacid:acceptor oxidoreductase family protein n=1 Tax=uncultured Sphingomonas sp. TaxID=158754 RepID=UPI0035CC3479